MITSAKDYPVLDILKSDANVKYVIPKYQRSYIWGKWNWEVLFDDIVESDGGHFLGSIICIDHGLDALRTRPLEMIDGQQRLTTLSLLYAALYKWIKSRDDLTEEQRLELLNLKRRLVLKDDQTSLKLEPSYQSSNYQDYMAALQEAGILSDVPIPPGAGNRRIIQAYRYFWDRLNNGDVWNLYSVLELLDKVNGAVMVKIEVNSHSDAFTLFESLNNRGVPLSALDLIKNKLLAELEKQKIDTIDVNFYKWNHLLENLSEDSAVQQRFLRQFYSAFKYKEKVGVEGIGRATRSTLIRIYEKLIDSRAKWIFEELCDKGKVYNRLVNSSNEANSKEVEILIQNLDRIGGVASYSFLLFMLSELNPSNEEIVSVLNTLIPYFVRRNLTDKPPTRDLDQIFIDLNSLCLKSQESGMPDIVKGFLSNPVRCASDEDFKKKLSGDIYEDNVGVTRFILCSIEEYHQTREKLTDLWKRDEKGHYIWTVEHIFPQGENIPQPWIDMIAGGDKQKAEEYRKQYVHKLGNLTLTGYNSKLGNKSFEEKKNRTDRDGNDVGYLNGLFLNKSLCQKDGWTIEDINCRTDQLVVEAVELFKI